MLWVINSISVVNIFDIKASIWYMYITVALNDDFIQRVWKASNTWFQLIFIYNMYLKIKLYHGMIYISNNIPWMNSNSIYFQVRNVNHPNGDFFSSFTFKRKQNYQGSRSATTQMSLARWMADEKQFLPLFWWIRPVEPE